jgi:hypothetical protein
MKPAEHVRKRHQKYLVAILIACMQGPRSPVVRAKRIHITLNDLYGALVRFDQIFDIGPTLIHDNQLRIGAMEKYVGHDRLPVRTHVKHRAAVFTNGERVIKLTGDSQPSGKVELPRGKRGEMISGGPSKAFGSNARNGGALMFPFGASFTA